MTTTLRKPAWMKRKLPSSFGQKPVEKLLRDLNLVTVCEEARCPNRSECFSHKTATFMLLGDTCTRKCRFCSVTKGKPQEPDSSEPAHLAEAVKRLGLKHVVLTSVNRDDLKDGGAQHWARCIQAIRTQNPAISIEVLTPDFQGRQWQIDIVSDAKPEVYNHNIETVPSHYLRVRPGARYERSLALLRSVKERHPNILTKSGIMLGLGETKAEVLQVFRDLRQAKVDILTVGQYLQPNSKSLPIQRYIPPEEFQEYKYKAMLMGFSSIASGTYIRSSYNAAETFLDALG